MTVVLCACTGSSEAEQAEGSAQQELGTVQDHILRCAGIMRDVHARNTMQQRGGGCGGCGA